MEELKTLIELVSKLPALAIWVLVAFWCYKVIVIGSVYGLIRFAIDKLYSWLTKPKHETVDFRVLVDGMVIDNAVEPLMTQMRRITGYHKAIGESRFIHTHGANVLREALDDWFAKQKQEKKDV